MKVYLITSAKMEELYIEDWINYHLSLGVDKIIINDNNDDEYPYKLKDILKKYIESDKIIIEYYYKYHTLENNRREEELSRIYTWLYNKYKNEFDWALKIDIDEYLEIPETNNNLKKFLSLDKFKNYDSIVLSWTQKGISKNLPEESNLLYFPIPVQERCHNIEYVNELWFKCIIKSINEDVVISHHIPYFSENRMCLTNGKSVQEALDNKFCNYYEKYGITSLYVNFNNALKLSKYAYLNHYRDITVEECYYKHIKIFDKPNKNQQEWFKENHYKQRNLYKIYLESKRYANNM